MPDYKLTVVVRLEAESESAARQAFIDDAIDWDGAYLISVEEDPLDDTEPGRTHDHT